MELTDIAKIVFGALLGQLISSLTTWLQRRTRRKETEKLLALELKKIKWEIDRWSKAAENFNVFPTTELPMLQFLGATELLSLSNTVGTLAYSLQYDLRKAEIFRKIAADTQENQESQIFRIHIHLYKQYQKSAQKTVDALSEELKLNMTTNPST